MVVFGGLEFLAAGYLLAEHNRIKKEEQRAEDEEAWRRQALQRYSPRHQKLPPPPQHQQHRRRRYSDSEKDERRYQGRDWSDPKKERRHRNENERQRREKPREDPRRSSKSRGASSSPAPRHGGLAPAKHQSRPHDGHNPYGPSSTLSAPFTASQQHLASSQPPSHLHRTGSDPPPLSRTSHNHSHQNGHNGHNSMFPQVPPHMYRSSPLSQAQGQGPAYPTYHPPSPPSPPLPPSALSSRPQYSTPPPLNGISAIALPPPRDGAWELPASDMSQMAHPNPAGHNHHHHHHHHGSHHHSNGHHSSHNHHNHQQHDWDDPYEIPLRPRAASSSAVPSSSRPHVHFADGLDVHGNIADPPPPYREF